MGIKDWLESDEEPAAGLSTWRVPIYKKVWGEIEIVAESAEEAQYEFQFMLSHEVDAAVEWQLSDTEYSIEYCDETEKVE